MIKPMSLLRIKTAAESVGLTIETKDGPAVFRNLQSQPEWIRMTVFGRDGSEGPRLEITAKLGESVDARYEHLIRIHGGAKIGLRAALDWVKDNALVHLSEAEQRRRRRVVHGWAFMVLSPQEVASIHAYQAGGLPPERWAAADAASVEREGSQ